jgi:hypothetical protein
LFGKPETGNIGSVFAERIDVKPPPYGTEFQQKSTTEVRDVKPVGLFGKVKQEETGTKSSVLFGGNKIKEENQSKEERGHSSHLFGKGKSEGGEEEENKGLFGKRMTENSSATARGTGLFGKGKALSQTLFNNPLKKEGRV